jgi:hypothetical protein
MITGITIVNSKREKEIRQLDENASEIKMVFGCNNKRRSTKSN